MNIDTFICDCYFSLYSMADWLCSCCQRVWWSCKVPRIFLDAAIPFSPCRSDCYFFAGDGLVSSCSDNTGCDHLECCMGFPCVLLSPKPAHKQHLSFWHLSMQITDLAVDDFTSRGILLDTSTVLPAFQDPFPYELLFNWVRMLKPCPKIWPWQYSSSLWFVHEGKRLQNNFHQYISRLCH